MLFQRAMAAQQRRVRFVMCQESMNVTDDGLSTAAREGSIVTVILVPQSTEYKVHKALLVEHSEYFKRALTGSWKEAEERTVRLDGLDDSTCRIIRALSQRKEGLTVPVDVFVDWLYTQKIEKTLESRLYRKLEQAMMKCYIFGDRFQALGYKTAILQQIIENFKGRPWVPFQEAIIIAFAHLPQDDVMLELLVDAQCNGFHHEENSQDVTKLPHKFLVRVVECYSKKVHRSKWKIDADMYQLKSKSN